MLSGELPRVTLRLPPRIPPPLAQGQIIFLDKPTAFDTGFDDDDGAGALAGAGAGKGKGKGTAGAGGKRSSAASAASSGSKQATAGKPRTERDDAREEAKAAIAEALAGDSDSEDVDVFAKKPAKPAADVDECVPAPSWAYSYTHTLVHSSGVNVAHNTARWHAHAHADNRCLFLDGHTHHIHTAIPVP